MLTLNQNAPAAKAVKVDSSHYYGHTTAAGWFPLYTPEKNFTLREARKVMADGGVAVPSVTAYISELNKKQVTDWKMEQVARACWNYPRDISNDCIEDYTDKVVAIADRASLPARDLGSKIHAAIELAVAGKDYDAAMDVYVTPVLEERAKWGLESVAQEKCVGSLAFGYGGRVDDICQSTIICDIKSRGKLEAYPTDWLQIAAYGYAEFGDVFFLNGAGIVFAVSTKEPGKVEAVMKPGVELLQAFDAFIGLTGTWRYNHRYDPRVIAGKPTGNNHS